MPTVKECIYSQNKVGVARFCVGDRRRGLRDIVCHGVSVYIQIATKAEEILKPDIFYRPVYLS